MIYYTLTGRHVEQPGMDNDVRPPQRTDFPHLGRGAGDARPSAGGLPGYIAIPEVGRAQQPVRRVQARARRRCAAAAAAFLVRCSIRSASTAIRARPRRSPRSACPPTSLPSERIEQRRRLLSILDAGSLGRTQEANVNCATGGRPVAAHGRVRRRQAFTLDGEPPPFADRYGRHRFGRAVLLARRLAEAGVPMIAIHFNEMTICDGWDTHAKNFEALQGELLPMLDQSLSALLEDLDAARPAGRDAGGGDGRVRPHAARSTPTPAATTGASASRSCWPAAAFAAARSSAHPTGSAPIRSPTRSIRSTSTPPCTTAWASTPSRRSTIRCVGLTRSARAG